MDHRLRRTEKLRGTGIGAKLASARKIRDDDRRQNAKYDLADQDGDVVARADAALGPEHRAIDDVAGDPREENHERVDDALDQRERHHVAVGDVRQLMAQHRFDFFPVHRLQQASRHSDQRRVPECAGRERVGLALVDGNLRHRDAGRRRELPDRRQQPRLVGVARRADHPRARCQLRHRLGHQERDDRADESDDEREYEERRDVDSIRLHDAIEPEQTQHDRQHQHDGEIGDEEQDDSLHWRLRLLDQAPC